MNDCKKLTVKPNAFLSDVLLILNRETITHIVLVVDENNRLIGTITDGDVRRALLAGFTTKSKIKEIMFSDFKSIKEGANDREIQAAFDEFGVLQLPEIDKQGRVVRLHLVSQLTKIKASDSIVVIMAGGLGSRLSPLTNSCPKPMLKIGGKPILEVIIENFKTQGFCNFYISINYLGEQIVKYFGDGSNLEVNIEYVREKDRLGTAGALGLLPQSVIKDINPLIVINGDVLTKIDFKNLLRFHEENNSDVTMSVRDYSVQIPYGVVAVNDNKVSDITEKPLKKYFVNAGIYAINPNLLNKIIKNAYIDMPDFLDTLLNDGLEVNAFPIHEYWMDIGQHEQLKKAKKDYFD